PPPALEPSSYEAYSVRPGPGAGAAHRSGGRNARARDGSEGACGCPPWSRPRPRRCCLAGVRWGLLRGPPPAGGAAGHPLAVRPSSPAWPAHGLAWCGRAGPGPPAPAPSGPGGAPAHSARTPPAPGVAAPAGRGRLHRPREGGGRERGQAPRTAKGLAGLSRALVALGPALGGATRVQGSLNASNKTLRCPWYAVGLKLAA